MNPPTVDVPDSLNNSEPSRSTYPVPSYLNFVPGGVSYRKDASHWHTLAQSSSSTPRASRKIGQLVQQAKLADDRLRQYSLVYGARENVTPDHFLPSLSVLAHAAFGRLTGCPATQAKAWADSMVAPFLQAEDPGMPANEQEIWKQTLGQPASSSETTAHRLKLLSQLKSDGENRPCGYVFQRGDIAWNCRTCQTDATCVICNDCFQQSDHTGHEVYFHRTSPGGCCDCGDAEAWKMEGCCSLHRPRSGVSEELKDDPMEAVRAGQRGLEGNVESVKALPPRLAAALGVVIGAAVQALMDAVDGAGAGADPVQWKRRWADEAAKIANGVSSNQDYGLEENPNPIHLNSFWNELEPRSLPSGYSLQLRLHNDDVHTFDEVIDALHEPRAIRRGDERNTSLVPLRDQATEMTHHVDADGQVTVKQYSNLPAAMQGFQKLKKRGLHCAVVSVAQVQAEHRTRVLASWLSEISAAHPAAAALVVHALVQTGADHSLGGSRCWSNARSIPCWSGLDGRDEREDCLRRFDAFPPHLLSSYVTPEEAEMLHSFGLQIHPEEFIRFSGTNPHFYETVPYRLASARYHKSPHSLWGTLPGLYSDPVPLQSKHPLLHRLSTGVQSSEHNKVPNTLTEKVFVVDTDLRKQQEADKITSTIFTHRLPGLHLISGVGITRMDSIAKQSPPLPSPMNYRHLLGTSSFRAPLSPILLLLLLDPYPTKQLRSALHGLVLSLLTDGRFKSRFAGALGVAYRPLSTLFCAGVGTEADTPLHFTVQIFTAGSLVRALGSGPAVRQLLLSDDPNGNSDGEASIGVFVCPISHTIVRCIHTNLLGATKEVNMILNNTTTGNNDTEEDGADQAANDNLLAALSYVAGEHPLMSMLPSAPDDGFLDSRTTRHKRLPHLLRDLEYVVETPGTAYRLLLPQRFPVYEGPSLSFRGEDVLAFPDVFARMLRLAQGVDRQKRKISGGHVEYEQNRWLEAFGLSLNLAGTRDALCGSPSRGMSPLESDTIADTGVVEALGNLAASIVREIKLWLYKEGLLETGLPVPSSGPLDLAEYESLQRSTLHVPGSLAVAIAEGRSSGPPGTVALSCATGIKMTETQLCQIENALKAEHAERIHGAGVQGVAKIYDGAVGPVMADWLRVPHAPLNGDSLSFHLPLHRALAECIRCACSLPVPEAAKRANSRTWWKIPVLDGDSDASNSGGTNVHPLVPVIKATLRSVNCKVVWSTGPDCSPQEAQRRRARSRAVSASIAVAKVIHSIADHPVRCLAAAQQIERHLWARNGSSVAGMAMNYSSSPLCRTFRDLDLLLVQLSAAGMSVGMGARRICSLLLSRFSMDGYLVDPEKRNLPAGSPMTIMPYGVAYSPWIKPPRHQDPDHAIVLAESFFSTICVLVSELPPPPPDSPHDNTYLKHSIRRELLHALTAEPRSRSEAISAASVGILRKEDSEGGAGNSGSGGLFKDAFAQVLDEISKPKAQSASRPNSGPPAFDLKADYCDEYDPSFFHLRRNEHQHAMDVVARLRKQKLGDDYERTCLPVVAPPPKAHPRFLACRLILHLSSIDASIRRALLFALTNGSWLPPTKPETALDPNASDVPDMAKLQADAEKLQENFAAVGEDVQWTAPDSTIAGGVPLTTFDRDIFKTAAGKRGEVTTVPFNADVVASSSVSFLEVLQVLTLQVHTLEECASLHRTLPDIDEESRSLSFALSINSYLGRLVKVPDSLVDAWALLPFPEGPLESRGSGEKRGSILGLLVALFEHRGDQTSAPASEGGDADDGHGGARVLVSSGLKWLLRFVFSLVDGAPSVAAAVKCATTGERLGDKKYTATMNADPDCSSWTIDEDVRNTIRGMLSSLPDLWPKEREKVDTKASEASAKKQAAGKAAQRRALERMKKQQMIFKETITPSPETPQSSESNDETELCIICRCDDADGENNGPLGYLGHVQRSRAAQMRTLENMVGSDCNVSSVGQTYRVVGHKGCQLRKTEAMDSKALTCLPRGSVVTILKAFVKEEYDILSRRVFVRHTSTDPHTLSTQVTEGWASMQSTQGYVILSPLVDLCFTNTRWGSTRPVVKQCGHAAHLKCVETHTLSIHQRAAGDQPYDGRFAANIDDGEFLCPFCKQLSNILVPKDNSGHAKYSTETGSNLVMTDQRKRPLREILCAVELHASSAEGMSAAQKDFGSKLHAAMIVPWERSKKKKQQWHASIQKWDYEEDVEEDSTSSEDSVGSTLRLLRQQLISWAAVGHTAAAAEASARSVEEVQPFGTFAQTEDPWQGYGKESHLKRNHPMLLELQRTMTGASGLLESFLFQLSDSQQNSNGKSPSLVVNGCLSDIMEGVSWVNGISQGSSPQQLAFWSEITALIAALPCHVSSDGSIPLRSEARAAAAAMWAVKGVGTSERQETDPPVPLSVRQLFINRGKLPPVPSNWGTMKPWLPPGENSVTTTFRPFVASAFLYTPFVAWDMSTLAGAVLSTCLLNETKNLPTPEELLDIAKVFMVGRLIQAVVTPGGFDTPGDMELDEEDCWASNEVGPQGEALAKLVAHCQNMTRSKNLNADSDLAPEGGQVDASGALLLAGIGRAILPFSRTLVLLLRACSSAIDDRSKPLDRGTLRGSSDLEKFLTDQDLMAAEDGFHFLKMIDGPFPTELIDSKSGWFGLINRWLVAVVGLELHHGSMGRHIVPSTAESGGEFTLADSVPRPNDAIPVVNRRLSGSSSDFEMSDMEDVESCDDGMDETDNRARLAILDHALAGHQVGAFEEDSEADVDEAEMESPDEMIVFPNQLLIASDVDIDSNPDVGESSEDYSDSGSDEDSPSRDTDRKFAHSSRSPILSYQPSLLGIEEVGPAHYGSLFEFSKASAIMSDFSHLGLKHVRNVPSFTLVKLPKSFVELYNLVNKAKGREEHGQDEDAVNAETAICLLTGAVMRSGAPRKSTYGRMQRPLGACTIHARTVGSGIGIFFLVQKCTVLLMHNNKSAYSPSLFVDEHGEEDPGLRRGRPLFLNEPRYRALEQQWRQQGIPRQVAQIRSTSDRVIRDNWY